MDAKVGEYVPGRQRSQEDPSGLGEVPAGHA